MATEQKTTLLDVRLNLTDAIKEMAEYQQKIEELSAAESELRRQIKQSGDADGSLRRELVKTREERKAYSKEVGELSRQVQNGIIAENKYQGTLKGLCAELSVAKDRLRAMKMTDPGWGEQRDKVDELNSEIKALEQSYGVYSRDVGNYGKATAELRGEMEDLLKTLKSIANGADIMDATANSLSSKASGLKSRISELELAMLQSGDASSEESQKAKQELDELKGKLGEVQGEMQKLGENQSMDGFAQSMQFASSSLGVFIAAASLGGKQMEALSKITKNLSLVTAALNAVRMLSEQTQKKSIVTEKAWQLLQKAGITQTQLQTKAEAAKNTVQGKGSIVTKAIAAAQWAWNAALAANPVMLAVTAIAALVAGITLLVGWLGKSQSEMAKSEQATKSYEQAISRLDIRMQSLNTNFTKTSADITQEYNKQVQAALQTGASAEYVARLREQAEAAMLEAEIKHTTESILLQKEQLKAQREQLSVQESILAAMLSNSAKWRKKHAEDIESVRGKVDDLRKGIASSVSSINNDIATNSDNITKQVEDAYNRRKEAADRHYDALAKRLSAFQAIAESALSMGKDYIDDYTKTSTENAALRFAHEQEYAAKEFELRQRYAKRGLEAQRESGKLTTEEYGLEMAKLQAASDAFYLSLSDAQQKYQQGLVESAIALAGGARIDRQREEIEAKYAASLKAIRDDAQMSADERAFYEIELEKRKNEELKALDVSAEKKKGDELLKLVQERYKGDVRAFAALESERLELEAEQLRALIAERKKSGLETLEQERELAAKEAAVRAAKSGEALQVAWQDARKRYEIEKDYIEKELEAEELAAEKRAELEQQLAELESRHRQERLDSVKEYADQVADLMSSVNDLASNLGEASVNRAESEADAKKAALEKQLNAGLISQKKYDKQVAAIDADLDKKKAEISRRQAMREKALSAMQIAVNTATAIMKIWADVPKRDFGVATVALTTLAAATGAAQLAAVAAEPLPTAAKGGLVQGASHRDGGVLVNTEGDERIVSKKPSKAFPELLNLISYIGKHASVPDTGYAARMLAGGGSYGSAAQKELDYDRLAAKIGAQVGDALRDLKVYASIEEIRDESERYARIERSARI